MARRSKGRRRRRAWPKQLSRAGQAAMFLLVLALLGAAYGWHRAGEWRPDEKQWPDQGALVSAADGVVDFDTLAGLGASFVYLEASDGAKGQDRAFSHNLAAARAAGLMVGAAHRFDPCAVADGQSANFVTQVPRDPALLPPALLLEDEGRKCPGHGGAAAVQSELMTLVNQIEAHAGKPAILAPDAAFDDRYEVSRRIDRNLWLHRDFLVPAYGTREFVMWTANRWYRGEASDGALRWVVVRP